MFWKSFVRKVPRTVEPLRVTTSSSQVSPTATFVPLLDVASLPPFNPKEDPNTLAVRWKLWKRSFNLYLVAKGITKDEQKTALLLHTGGLNFQEL